MVHLEEILKVGSLVIPFFIGAATFMIKNAKNAKIKKRLNNSIKIMQQLQKYVVIAEEFLNYSGKEKKEYVMTLANQYAIDSKIQFNREQVSQQIEELIAVSKSVNARDKDIYHMQERKLSGASTAY